MLVKSYAAAVQGISATVVTVEVNCSKGIQFFLVGLPDVAVRESHERIISALQVCGYKFPRNRIVINMAPDDHTCPARPSQMDRIYRGRFLPHLG